MTDMTAFERRVADGMLHRAGPVRPVDDLAVFESVAAASRSLRWGFTMFSALRFAAAAVVVAVFGGFLIAGILTTPDLDQTAPAAVTAPPSPMTTEDLLSGMVAEEVEPGVFRVDNDGVRDLASADYDYVVVGQDRSIWLGSHTGHLSRLGVAEAHDWKLGEEDRSLRDFEVGPDGTVWAVVMESDGSATWSSLRSFNGEAWTTHAVAPFIRFVGDVEIAPDGVVWAALSDGVLGYLDPDGSTWQTIDTPTTPPAFDLGEYGFVATEAGVWARHRNGVWHYADGVWEPVTYGDPDAGTMPDGVFWGIGPGDTGDDETLYRHDGTGWQRWSLKEQRMLGSWGPRPSRRGTGRQLLGRLVREGRTGDTRHLGCRPIRRPDMGAVPAGNGGELALRDGHRSRRCGLGAGRHV